jgi:hypothetical protein
MKNLWFWFGEIVPEWGTRLSNLHPFRVEIFNKLCCLVTLCPLRLCGE